MQPFVRINAVGEWLLERRKGKLLRDGDVVVQQGLQIVDALQNVRPRLAACATSRTLASDR